MSYDKRHGGPYDRGSADKWYGRVYEPHYYVGDTAASERIELQDMSAAEIVAYSVGYKEGDVK